MLRLWYYTLHRLAPHAAKSRPLTMCLIFSLDISPPSFPLWFHLLLTFFLTLTKPFRFLWCSSKIGSRLQLTLFTFACIPSQHSPVHVSKCLHQLFSGLCSSVTFVQVFLNIAFNKISTLSTTTNFLLLVPNWSCYFLIIFLNKYVYLSGTYFPVLT